MLMSDEQEASFLTVYKTTSSKRDSPNQQHIHTPTYKTYLHCFPKTIKKYVVRVNSNIAAIELLKQYVRLHPFRSSCLFRAAFESRYEIIQYTVTHIDTLTNTERFEAPK